MIVYTATNTNNGKVYVGKTIRTLAHAKSRHKQRALHNWKNGCKSRFYTAIRKHGWEAFVWEIVFHGSSDQEIQQHERGEILKLKTLDPSFGYNMTPGGDGGAGRRLSQEQKALLSAAIAGEKNRCFGKFGTDHPASGHVKSAEARARISEAHKGKPKTEEQRKKLSEARRANSRWSEEMRAKASQMRKNGVTFQEIAAHFDSSPGTVFGIIRKYDQSQVT